MNQVYLINLATIQRFEDISSNVSPDRIKSFVRKAQELDLKLLLGQAFYYDLIKQCNDDGSLNNENEQYDKFLNGGEYLDANGHLIIYEGLIPALVYFTLSRFVEADAVRFTATGPVIKTHESAVPLSIADSIKLAQNYRSIANAYANDIEKFLWCNQKDYPLWQFDTRKKSARQPAARIRAIDKTTTSFPLENTDPLIIYNQWQ